MGWVVILLGVALVWVVLSSNSQTKAVRAFSALDSATPWLQQQQLDLPSVRFSSYQDSELLRTPGTTLLVGSGQTHSGEHIGFALEVAPGHGALHAELVEPHGVVTWHRRLAGVARAARRPLIDVMLEAAANHRRRMSKEIEAEADAVSAIWAAEIAEERERERASALDDASKDPAPIREVSNRAVHGRAPIPSGPAPEVTTTTSPVQFPAGLASIREVSHRAVHGRAGDTSQLATPEAATVLQRTADALPHAAGYVVLSGETGIRFVIVYSDDVQEAFDAFTAWAATTTDVAWHAFTSHGFYGPTIIKTVLDASPGQARQLAHEEAERRERMKPGSVWLWPPQ